MIITIVVVHDGTIQENYNKIEKLKTFIDVHKEQVGGGIISRYTLKNFVLPHELLIYHIVPYQPNNTNHPYEAEICSNFYDVYSWSVKYGKSDNPRLDDSDKVGKHPRFFNWGLKRSTDNGSDITLYLEDIDEMDLAELAIYVNSLIDPNDKHEFIDHPSGKIATLRMLKEVGQLNEKHNIKDGFNDLKQRIIKKGLKHG